MAGPSAQLGKSCASTRRGRRRQHRPGLRKFATHFLLLGIYADPRPTAGQIQPPQADQVAVLPVAVTVPRLRQLLPPDAQGVAPGTQQAGYGVGAGLKTEAT